MVQLIRFESSSTERLMAAADRVDRAMLAEAKAEKDVEITERAMAEKIPTGLTAARTIVGDKCNEVFTRWRANIADVDRANGTRYGEYQETIDLLRLKSNGVVPGSVVEPLAELPDERTIQEFREVYGVNVTTLSECAEAVRAVEAARGRLAEAQCELQDARLAFAAQIEPFGNELREFEKNLAALKEYAQKAKDANRKVLAAREAELADVKKRLGE